MIHRNVHACTALTAQSVHPFSQGMLRRVSGKVGTFMYSFVEGLCRDMPNNYYKIGLYLTDTKQTK